MNKATLDLWRVAESGDVDELAAILPRVSDINARNEHGMTALMRAAQHGHVKIVRELLENGADANVKRNDKFTALALAAFFGHTEVVRALMEHGADCDARTRADTSPRMWATARTFGEVAGHLDSRRVATAATARARKQAQPAPAIAPVVKTPAVIPVVKTLKDPPEIWDLVHEVPKGFDARSAFVARLQSMRGGWTLVLATVVILICSCAVGVWVLRGVQARSAANLPAPETSSSTEASKVSLPPANATVESGSATAETAQPAAPAATESEVPAATDPKTPAVTVPTEKPLVARKLSSRSRQNSSHSVEAERTPQPAASEPVAAAPPSEKPAAPAIPSATTKPKMNAPLSPQLITPAKGSQPKTKVIQWP